MRTPCEGCRTAEVGAPAELVVAAAAPPGDWADAGAGARRCPERPRDRTLTNAYSISDEKTNTRQTIIQMSIA